MRLTLRTLLAYLDDTLPPQEAMIIGRKVAESEKSRELMEKIKRLTRKRGLATPSGGGNDSPSNPNTVAEYLSDALPADAVAEMEAICLESDVNLAEVAACHQILTLLLSEPARVPPTARKRMYELVQGPESLPNRKPGMTIPIGGMPADQRIPERDERDEGLLIGLSPLGLGFRWLLAACLAGFAILIAWLAWPHIEMRNGVLPPPRTEPVKPAEVVPAEHETLPDPNPKAEPAPMGPAPIPKNEEGPQPKPESFSADPARRSIGVFTSRDQVVLASMASGPFSRIPDQGPITTTDRITCLPGYKGKLKLDTNVVLELWANVPDQAPLGPLESSLTFHVPSATRAADLTLHSGRLYVQAGNMAGASIRVRFGNQIWDFTLPDANTELVIERTNQRIRGFVPLAKYTPQSRLVCSTLRGTVAVVNPQSQSRHAVSPDEAITIASETGTVTKSNELAKSMTRQSVYPDAMRASAAQKALSAFSGRVSPMDRILVKFTEAVDGDSNALARCAVFGQCAVGDWVDATSALLDPNRPLVRDAAAVALRAAIAADPAAMAAIETTLVERSRFTPEQAQRVLSLLRGPSPAELKSPSVLYQLVDDLTADTLPVRELSHRILVSDVDPEATRNPSLARFDATGPVEARVAAQQHWRKRVEELAKPLGVNLSGIPGF